jgi:hypothetical protein
LPKPRPPPAVPAEFSRITQFLIFGVLLTQATPPPYPWAEFPAMTEFEITALSMERRLMPPPSQWALFA